MSVDAPLLVTGLIAFLIVAGWLLSDWRVRSARAVALLVGGLAVAALSAIAFDSALFSMLGLLAGVTVTSPVVLRHPSVGPLDEPDAVMVHHIEAAEQELVRAGLRFRRNPGSRAEYADNLEAIRRRLRQIEPLDHEWRKLLRRMDEEISRTVALASGRGSHQNFRQQRETIRREYRALIMPRRKFWR